MRTAALISSGRQHSCAVIGSSKLQCWGDNTYGQLGDDTNTQRTHAAAVSLNTNSQTITHVSCGEHHTCIILQGLGVSLYCWGYNWPGQLGLGDYNNRLVPTSVPDPDLLLVIRLIGAID